MSVRIEEDGRVPAPERLFRLAHDACATRDLQFGERRVAAADVHTAYLAALNGAFAAVRPATEIAAGI